MTPQYTREELIEMIGVTRGTDRKATLNIPFSIGQNNLIRYIDKETEIWIKHLKTENKFSIKIAKEAIAELNRFKTVIFCDKDELPFYIEGKFNEIVKWRLQKDK